MIVVKLQGGLGNQLFQWAFYRSLKSDYKTECYLDKSFYDNAINSTHRSLSLNKFPKITFNIFQPEENFILHNISDNFNYQKFILPINQDYCFVGFWQSEKYFKELETQIKYELSPTKNIKNQLHDVIPLNNNSISLHVRRTDYLNSNGFHSVQDINYYNESVDLIGDYDYIYIFSDDINWCKENLKYKNMIFVENNDDVTDIWLQSFCKNNIIANSSFSWWGAWLNNNLDKKVIAPSQWFGDHVNLNTKDIIPKEWIII